MEFQIVEIHVVNKAVRAKAGLCMTFEFLNIGIEPDGPAKVKGLADLIQRMKYFMCPGIFCVVCDRDVPDESIVFAYFSIHET